MTGQSENSPTFDTIGRFKGTTTERARTVFSVRRGRGLDCASLAAS